MISDLIKKRLGSSCIVCGYKGNIDYHHIVPRCKGGKDTIDNIVPLCPNHHAAIHRKRPAHEYKKTLSAINAFSLTDIKPEKQEDNLCDDILSFIHGIGNNSVLSRRTLFDLFCKDKDVCYRTFSRKINKLERENKLIIKKKTGFGGNTSMIHIKHWTPQKC